MDNGVVTLTIEEIEGLLARAADRPVEVPVVPVDLAFVSQSDPVETVAPSDMSFSHLDHALQTAAVLRDQFPDDLELAVAGLVHDLGHLLPGIDDAAHAEAGAVAIRVALGERVAGMVGLHVEAKRYLVACQSSYAGELAADSVASLALQGGPMSAAEQQRFDQLPFAHDALLLRRADESGKVDGLEVAGLAEWMGLVRTHWAPSA
jgi:predicted HD phosphohydrolase